MLSSRKKDWKRGLERHAAAASRRHEVDRVRKEERDRSFAVKRQRVCLEAGISSVADIHFSSSQVQETLEKARAAIGNVVVARGACLSQPWNAQRRQMPPLASCILSTLEAAAAAVTPVNYLRLVLSSATPPVEEIISFGGLEILQMSLEIGCELLAQTAYGASEELNNESVSKFRIEVELLVSEVVWCLAVIVGDDEGDHAAQVSTLLPELRMLFHFCASEQKREEHQFLNEPLCMAHAVSMCLGNLAADYPRLVLNVANSTSSPSDQYNVHPWDEKLAVFNMSIRLLTQCAGEFFKRDACSSASPQLISVAPESPLGCSSPLKNSSADDIFLQELQSVREWQSSPASAAALARTVTWLLSNMLRIRDKLVVTNFFHSTNAVSMLTEIVRFGSGVSVNEDICPSLISQNAEKRRINVVDLSPDDDIRGMVGETLWCFVYCLETDNSFAQLFFPPPDPNSSILSSPPLLEAIVKLVTTAASNVSQCDVPLLNPCNPVDPAASPRRAYHVDLLAPALHLLTLASLSTKPVDKTDQILAQSNFADCIVASSNFDVLLQTFLHHPHRGILRDTAQLLAVLAAGQPQHTAFVLRFLARFAQLMNSPIAFDIKREVASALVHLSLNHHHIHLKEVMRAEPSIVDSFLEMFTTSKFDEITILVGLDFIEGILEFYPDGRRILYNKNVIDVVESVQHLHCEKTFHRITNIIAKHFDDFEDADESQMNELDE